MQRPPPAAAVEKPPHAAATYNRLIIEYEAPGRLRENVNHGPTAHAIQQAKDYVEGVAHYLAGMMSSIVFNCAALAYSQAGGKSFGSPAADAPAA